MKQIFKALTIAGSDSGGGAGIQADLKTFSALGVYGASVITAITAQNTCAVTAVQGLATDLVSAQIDAVMDDSDEIPADAVQYRGRRPRPRRSSSSPDNSSSSSSPSDAADVVEDPAAAWHEEWPSIVDGARVRQAVCAFMLEYIGLIDVVTASTFL